MCNEAELLLQKALLLNPSDRAFIAHCLISSMEGAADEDVDEEWRALAEKRLDEIENNLVKTTTTNYPCMRNSSR